MKTLQHILVFVFMGTAAHVDGQSIDSTLNSWRGDYSLMGRGNRRSLAPGELLLMAPQGTLQELLAMDLDRFQLVVDHPKFTGRMRSIHYLRSGNGLEALYAEGDLRYITYDMNTLENASQSSVVSYDFWAAPYFHDDQLHFQNGHSNWHIHANRYYHSKINGEIERSNVDPWPEGAEFSIPLISDSSCILLPMHGLQDNWEAVGILHALDHGETRWETIGQLNKGFQRLESWKRVYNLQDYWFILRGGDIDVIRKSDLHVAKMQSSLSKRLRLLEDMEERHGSATVTKGNKVGLYSHGNGCFWEDIDSLSSGAEWFPLVIPLDEGSLEPARKGPDFLPGKRNFVLVIIGLQAAIIISLAVRGRRKDSPLPDPNPKAAGEGKPSELLAMMLLQSGRVLNTSDLDALFGLDDLESPETQRSRRSRMIQVANLEANALFGKPIIERSRSESDKRIVVYHIRDVAPTSGS